MTTARRRCSRFAPAQRGFSLIELVAFIVIAAVVGVGFMGAFTGVARTAGDAPRLTRAIQLAQERMELIVARRLALSFSSFTALGANADPCVAAPAAPACVAPAGYVVASAIQNNWGGDTNYRVITVNVTGEAAATLTLLVSAWN